jgi:hypothetical protein
LYGLNGSSSSNQDLGRTQVSDIVTGTVVYVFLIISQTGSGRGRILLSLSIDALMPLVSLLNFDTKSSSSANYSASDLGACGVGSGSSVLLTLFSSGIGSARLGIFLGNSEAVGKSGIGCGEFMQLGDSETCSVPTGCCGSFSYVMSESCPVQTMKAVDTPRQ